MKLKDKVAIITGGAKRESIGLAIVKEFLKQGAVIVIADILEKEGNELQNEITASGGKALFVKIDVRHSYDFKKLVNIVIENFGRIGILVNVAGICRSGALIDFEEEEWDRVMDINLKSVFLGCKHAGREMIKNKKGKIINFSFTAGKRGESTYSAYCTSKAGVISLTEALAQELGPYGVNVNAICPGVIYTSMVKDNFSEDATKMGITLEELKMMNENTIPLKRLGEAEEVAKMALFLASSDSDYITGVSYLISGGYELSQGELLP